MDLIPYIVLESVFVVRHGNASYSPPGWAALQEQARRSKDPEELARIIDTMNKLLTECEEAAGDLHKKKTRRTGGGKPDKRNGQ